MDGGEDTDVPIPDADSKGPGERFGPTAKTEELPPIPAAHEEGGDTCNFATPKSNNYNQPTTKYRASIPAATKVGDLPSVQ